MQEIILHDKSVAVRCWLVTNWQIFLPFALHVTDHRDWGTVDIFTYRQVRIVAVTVVNGSNDPRPPWPPSDVSDFWWLVPTDTEKPLPDQLWPSVDCHGTLLVNPPPPHPSSKLPKYNAFTVLSFRNREAGNPMEQKKIKVTKMINRMVGGEINPGGFKCVAVSTRPNVSLKLHAREKKKGKHWTASPLCFSARSLQVHRPWRGCVPPRYYKYSCTGCHDCYK